jgi:hypothetical protein
MTICSSEAIVSMNSGNGVDGTGPIFHRLEEEIYKSTRNRKENVRTKKKGAT